MFHYVIVYTLDLFSSSASNSDPGATKGFPVLQSNLFNRSSAARSTYVLILTVI